MLASDWLIPVMRSPGQQLRLGAARRGEVDGEVTTPGSLDGDMSLDMLQEVDTAVVSHLHLGCPAAGARNGHLSLVNG